MLNLEQIKRAYELKQQKSNIRDIATDIGCSGSEISYSLNTYTLCKEYFEQINKNNVQSFAPGADEKERLKKEYEKIDALHVEIQEEQKRLLEREAWLKLFVKNIIYKYRLKDKHLKEKIEKYKIEIDKNSKDIKEENFSLCFDLQKATKEKTDVLEEFEKYKTLVKFKYIAIFLTGGILSVLVLDLMYKFV